MEDYSKNVEGLVEYLVTNLVEDKDSIQLETQVDESADILINVKVDQNDIGRVIGKDGNIIKSIRTLARACVAKEDIRVDVELDEDE